MIGKDIVVLSREDYDNFKEAEMALLSGFLTTDYQNNRIYALTEDEVTFKLIEKHKLALRSKDRKIITLEGKLYSLKKRSFFQRLLNK